MVDVDTMAELLWARREDDGTALLFEDQTWSWAEFVAESEARAALLSSVGGPDEPGKPFHVGTLMDNVPEYLFLLGGAILSGATLVGINLTRRGEELAADIRGVDLDLLVTEEKYAGLLPDIDHRVPRVWNHEDAAYAARLEGLRGRAHPPAGAALDPATRLLLLFTSGSTGAPKAVACSTGRLAAICQLNPVEFTRDDVAYNAMPLFHGNAIMAAWGPCVRNGAAFAMRRRFSASGFLPDVQRFGATFFNYVGRSLAYVLARPESPAERDNRLRFGFGTEASPHDRAEFLRRFGCPLLESYGSSEGTIHIVPVPGTPEGSLGKPQVGYAADVVAEDGTTCPPAVFGPDGALTNPREAIGEIVARGAAVRFEGYYKNPTATAEKIHGDDYHTGDLAYRDAEGFFYYAGRTADWLRVDSENLASGPIERVIGRHPAVTAVAVYPVPDPHTGDQVAAALEVADGFDADDLLGFLRAQPDLGTKSLPSLLRVVEELPVTATRKVDKPRLRRMRWAGEGVLELRDDHYAPVDGARRQELDGSYGRHRTGAGTV